MTRTAPKTIQVYLRIRPPLPMEVANGDTFSTLEVHENQKQVTFHHSPIATAVSVPRECSPTPREVQKTFEFSHVFPPHATQQEVFSAFGARAVDAALNGEHGVLFAYGQTGSGKTFTLSNVGAEHVDGVVPRAIRLLWSRVSEERSTRSVEMFMSVLEVYNEQLYDLTRPKRERIHFSQRDQCARPVQSFDEALALYQTSSAKRESAETAMNERSSRSHLILSLRVLSKSLQTPSGGEVLDGKLLVCDLAGSERLKKSKAEGARRDEAVHINLSLLALGNAVYALSTGQRFVQLRLSLITMILRDALLGRGDTSILIAASPSDRHAHESRLAIEFGQRARGLKQESERHTILNYKSLYEDALIDNHELQEQLRARDAKIATLMLLIDELRGGVGSSARLLRETHLSDLLKATPSSSRNRDDSKFANESPALVVDCTSSASPQNASPSLNSTRSSESTPCPSPSVGAVQKEASPAPLCFESLIGCAPAAIPDVSPQETTVNDTRRQRRVSIDPMLITRRSLEPEVPAHGIHPLVVGTDVLSPVQEPSEQSPKTASHDSESLLRLVDDLRTENADLQFVIAELEDQIEQLNDLLSKQTLARQSAELGYREVFAQVSSLNRAFRDLQERSSASPDRRMPLRATHDDRSPGPNPSPVVDPHSSPSRIPVSTTQRIEPVDDKKCCSMM